MFDEAFLRRLGYRVHIDLPSTADYVEIFKRAATKHRIAVEQSSLSHLLAKYTEEGRAPKSCEPRDLLNRVKDICQFRGLALQLTPELIDLAWNNYFGRAQMARKAAAPAQTTAPEAMVVI